ncbi:ABC transporter ATP-binding protein, partial [Streptomyces sp. MCAF7]
IYGSPGIEQFAYLMPSRWAVGAAGATLDLGPGPGHTMAPWDRKKPNDTDPLWEHATSQWGIDILVLIALGVICAFVVARLLRRHEPEVMRK